MRDVILLDAEDLQNVPRVGRLDGKRERPRDAISPVGAWKAPPFPLRFPPGCVILEKLSGDHSRREEASPTEKRGIKIAAQNRKAFHDYFVEDRYESGIQLAGTEVKSIRAGTLNLKDAYCTVKDGELWVHGMHISPYEKGNIFNKDPVRSRRLLMHKREIRKLQALVKQDGYTLVPLSVYFKDARVKVEVGLCKGKKNYDKRDAAARRDAAREIDRTMKSRNR